MYGNARVRRKKRARREGKLVMGPLLGCKRSNYPMELIDMLQNFGCPLHPSQLQTASRSVSCNRRAAVHEAERGAHRAARSHPERAPLLQRL